MGRKIRVTAVLAVLAALASLTALAAGPAGATAEDGDGQKTTFVHASGTTGACGWWGEETTKRFVSVSVCGTDGLVVDDGVATQLLDPVVSVSRYVCSKVRQGACSGEQHEGPVGRDDVRIDPLLRRATVRTSFGACAVEVEFAQSSGPQPRGGLWESHGLAGNPRADAGLSQDMTSQAQWWGHVCGQFLVGQTGQAELWRRADGSVSGSKSGPAPPGE